jgi:PTH1 family peptidyl-tRNA hydrolase
VADSPWLIVGLGNPGPEYAGNRHNAGFMVVDRLAERTGGHFKKHKTQADVVEGTVSQAQVILAKPRCFMNEAGGPVAAVKRFFDIPLEHVVVVHDELDLGAGVVRLKVGGGDNGHNGLRSITKSLGSPNYVRIRFGIGRPPGQMQPADFVLSNFRAAERDEVAANVVAAAELVETLIANGAPQP